jgi:redox-sensitive bicupin YhaK (pirin superfamily)
MASDLITNCQLSDSGACHSTQLHHQKLPTRNAVIGEGLAIQRALPHRDRRMIGAWCFFDHFGPLDLKTGKELDIGPHPHLGLQTFTWLLSGEILHRDSLGSEQMIRPGEVNLMTSGKGIAHSEESQTPGLIQGVQLWLALPDSTRNCPPEFAHYSKLPLHEQDNLRITVVAGEAFKQQAPTKIHSPLIGLNMEALKTTTTTLPLNPHFEYGLLVLKGKLQCGPSTIEPGMLFYFGPGQSQLNLGLEQDTHVFLIGGEPFQEEILLWWNFVGRTKAELIQGVEDWEKGQRFGEVKGYGGARLKAPELAS